MATATATSAAAPPSTAPATPAAATEIAAPATAPATAPAAGPESLLIVHNVSKKKNFGELFRTAAALGVAEVVVVGAAKLSSHGAHGCVGHLKFSHFVKFDDAVAYVRGVRGARICGVEITPTSESVVGHPFGGTTAFLMGNEGQGLTPPQLEACEQFVYIPQHSDATASLNVNAACAVVLHHFAMWAALPEAPRDGYKYVLAPPPSSTAHSGIGIKQMRTLNADGSVLSHRRHLGATEADGGGEVDEDDEAVVDVFDDDDGQGSEDAVER